MKPEDQGWQSRLDAEETALLRRVVRQRYPRLLGALEGLGKVPLTEEQREGIRQALLEELLETGLQADDEPNERGEELDLLIGKLGSY